MSEPVLAAVEIEQAIAADLPSFDGHFPGAPVLPGAHLMALVLRAIAQRAEWARRVGATPTIQQVKFLAAVGPGQTLHIRLDDTPSAIAFSVRCGATPVARGTLSAPRAELASGPPPAGVKELGSGPSFLESKPT